MDQCPEQIVVNGTSYRRETSIPSGRRVVLVVDRGWIFAGDLDLESDEGMLRLRRAVWVFRWEGGGFDGVLKDPKSAKVQIRRLENDVIVPQGAEIFRIPVVDGWGL